MLKREFVKTRKDGVNLFRTYSDDNYYIMQNETGIKYREAVDVENSHYTYTETSEKAPPVKSYAKIFAEREEEHNG